MPDYQINLDLLRHAPSHCLFMHCLPASRGVEVTDEVMDHPRSIIFDQAENRLHTEKGLLVYLVYPRLKQAASELKSYHQEQISAFVRNLKLDG
jgi:putrescine carbamoyltransferase